jgi:hypothetical protein
MNGIFTRRSKYCRYVYKRMTHTEKGMAQIPFYAERCFRDIQKGIDAYNKIMAVLEKGSKNGQ